MLKSIHVYSRAGNFQTSASYKIQANPLCNKYAIKHHLIASWASDLTVEHVSGRGRWGPLPAWLPGRPRGRGSPESRGSAKRRWVEKPEQCRQRGIRCKVAKLPSTKFIQNSPEIFPFLTCIKYWLVGKNMTLFDAKYCAIYFSWAWSLHTHEVGNWQSGLQAPSALTGFQVTPRGVWHLWELNHTKHPAYMTIAALLAARGHT